MATPEVDRLMLEIFGEDVQVVDFVQTLLGYGLTGHTMHNILVFFYGSGGNGTKTISRCMMHLSNMVVQAVQLQWY